MPKALLDGPVGVPGVRLGDGAPALHTDPGHSLCSLFPPQAAVASLPLRYVIVMKKDRPEGRSFLLGQRIFFAGLAR